MPEGAKRPRATGIRSLSKKRKHSATFSDDCFDFSRSDDDFEELAKGFQPKNTKVSNCWALKIYSEWAKARRERIDETNLTKMSLMTDNKDALCEELCKFVVEIRKTDKTQYPPRTIQLILCGLQRYIRQEKPRTPVNFTSDPEFQKLRNVCDTYYRELHSKGIGAEVKRTPVLTIADEDKLWATSVLSLETPEGLLRAAFFYNGKNFCLRRGEEQRGLKLSQLKSGIATVNGEAKVYYEYTEHGSKNRTGGLKQLQMENKVVRQYESEDGGARCHVRILDKYLQKVPKEALEKDAFYVKALTKRPLDPMKPWFSAVPVGKNKLSAMVKEMCLEAGLAGSYTNHSLRAFGATALFGSGVSEALVQHRTGHRSLEGLRKYERVPAEQEL